MYARLAAPPKHGTQRRPAEYTQLDASVLIRQINQRGGEVEIPMLPLLPLHDLFSSYVPRKLFNRWLARLVRVFARNLLGPRFLLNVLRTREQT
jgi:hypothetical protein